MFPASRLGKTSTLARPATGLSGALREPISGTSAASACSGPSAASSGAFARSSFTASSTFSTWGPLPLPLVE